jgi:hypothetical protein
MGLSLAYEMVFVGGIRYRMKGQMPEKIRGQYDDRYYRSHIWNEYVGYCAGDY